MTKIIRCPGCRGSLNNFAKEGQLCGTCSGSLMLRLTKRKKR